MEPPTAEEQLCLDAVKAVRAAAREARSLRRVWAQLSRDLVALLCGLRPAIMLDYVVLPCNLLLGIVNSLRMHETGSSSSFQNPKNMLVTASNMVPLCTGRDLVVAEVNGCFYVICPDLALQQASVPAYWVTFQQHGMDTTCHWATAAQVQARPGFP